jgi:hypothetical protein
VRPRRTRETNHVFRLPGGNEDNDLWVRTGQTADGTPWSESTWELDADQGAELAAGATIRLRIYSAGCPPLALYLGPPMRELAR